MTTILPGATIGFLGGGQLGRMTALAARAMGYRVHALDPDPACSAEPVVDRLVTGRFDDADAAADLARHCDVVTLEIEQIGAASIAAASRHAPVRPGPAVLDIVRDRASQRAWLAASGFPQGEWRPAASLDALRDALASVGGRAFVKATTGGYDGRSQVRVGSVDQADDAWAQLVDARSGAPRPTIVERALDLAHELSVMVARSPRGETVVYPPALNHHERQVLAWSMLPGPLDPEIAARAEALARGIADAIGLEGILAVEMFLTRSGELLVNELAPRPHNSYHASELACQTSQFEQLVRAACDLPLGSVAVHRPAAIVNLFGDLWRDGVPDWSRALEVPGTRVHLYGKASARAGRKMGHISAVGATPEEALAVAQEAFGRLTAGSARPVGGAVLATDAAAS
jgi:5-(carboxyamino)imidazole ribonucleotide synthase